MGRSVQARKEGAIREAEMLLQQAVDVAATFGPNDMRRAHTRMGQAEFYLWSGHPERAEQAYIEAVTIGEATGGADHPEMVSLLEGLANFYYYRERYDEVAPLYVRILEIVRVATPHDRHEEARRLRNLAQVHQLRGSFAEAEPKFLHALRLVEASPNRSSGEVAEYLQARGGVLSGMGESNAGGASRGARARVDRRPRRSGRTGCGPLPRDAGRSQDGGGSAEKRRGAVRARDRHRRADFRRRSF